MLSIDIHGNTVCNIHIMLLENPSIKTTHLEVWKINCAFPIPITGSLFLIFRRVVFILEDSF